MKIYASIIVFIFSLIQIGRSQVGGDNTYEFLTLSPSARTTALGDYLISVKDDDINLALANPGLLNPSMSNAVSVSHNIHFAGLQTGYLAYGRNLESYDINLHGGLQYISYNQFELRDQFGNQQGEFSAAEYAFVLGASKMIEDKINLGANAKFISSRFESYNSFGIAFDIGMHYKVDSSSWEFSAVLKNIGLQISQYNDGPREKLPFDFQVGLSKRLEHLPFRFTIIGHDLHRWNLIYDDPNGENATLFAPINDPSPFKLFTDNLFRHLVFNGEFLLGKTENIRLRIAYNHHRRQELAIPNYFSLSGFSMGIGIRVKQFFIDYGVSSYHIAGGTHHFSIGTNIDRFRSSSPGIL